MNLEPLLKALSDALAGVGPAVQIESDGTFTLVDPAQLGLPENSETQIAAVVRTSGSTGTPKRTMLSIDSLAASSVGTAVALRGEGQWLLALPVHYVAGLQVLVRSLFAGTRPWAMDLSGGFTPEAFTEAALELTDKTRFTSLVPTQLSRLLHNPSAETLQVLRRFNAILLGGGPASPVLLEAARGAGLSVVTTYGMSETCGGCVYNGEPLEGVAIQLREGRVFLGGEVVAAGYLGNAELTSAVFSQEEYDGETLRWFQTGDLGELDADGRLRILGRADDVIISGGVKISPAAVLDGLHQIQGVREAFVGGIESTEWGQEVAAMVVADCTLAELHERVGGVLASHLRPKTVLLVSELPQLATGKPDRDAILTALSRAAEQF